MPLYIKDDATAELVAQFARRRGVRKQDAVRQAAQAGLDRVAKAIPTPRAYLSLAEGASDALSN